MSLKATSSGKDFELAPVGVHPARCYRVIDLGTQTTEWQGQTKKAHKVMLTWELLGDERMADGRPFSISKRFTASTHEKGVRCTVVSKCTTCISPCTPASVRPAHKVLTGCVAKRPSAASSLSWMVWPEDWLCQPW